MSSKKKIDINAVDASAASHPRASFPLRNLDRLYCSASTYLCAIGANPLKEGQSTSSRPCVPCGYKVCNFDVALDEEFTKLVPNQRPEQCPRDYRRLNTTSTFTNESTDDVVDGMMGFKCGMRVLTVGDGDFSFSLAVAKRNCMVVATSYEDLTTLQRVYPAFDDTLNTFQKFSTNNIVGYNVDATQLQKTLPANVIQSNIKFHRICWNFPCTAIGRGQDGQNSAMEENKELLRKFMANSLQFLEQGGEIFITHKTKPPYNQWEMETVAMEEIHKNGNPLEFEYRGRLVFDKCNLHPYVPRKALDKKSFPCHDACVYVFGFRKESTESTIPDSDTNEEGISTTSLDPSSIIPVTTELIESIRTKHMTLAHYESELKYTGKKRYTNISEGNPKSRKKQRRRK